MPRPLKLAMLTAGLLLAVTMLLVPLLAPAGPAYAQVRDETQTAIVRAVRTVAPSVVNIDTVIEPPANEQVPDIFREILPPGMGEPFPREGVASGVIVDRRGYVLTNYHVVRRTDRVTVTLNDGRQFPARVVGSDSATDIAVVKITAPNLTAIQLGSANDLPIGSWLIAVGSPFRLQNTVTVGVLSARGRTLRAPDGRVLTGLLQTDAAINPGNSGGALVDIEGRLIGVPTAIMASAQGIGFAVSVDVARPILRQLIETGRVQRAWMGVYYSANTAQLRRQLNLATSEGLVVMQVLENSPAARAGLRRGDVVLRVNGETVSDPEELRAAVATATPGQTLNLRIMRGREQRTVAVRLGVAPAEPPTGG